ncbi:universal stress protein [Streptomyces sp. NPDC088246]|uniref:universal stress protein n=1 Tax=Streptomyces sp. NPDC088246 TaxID=3365842 RepID=UPI0038065466
MPAQILDLLDEAVHAVGEVAAVLRVGAHVGERPDEAGRGVVAEGDAAADRLGRPAVRLQAHGRAEEEVVRAAEGAGLLICARDGDRHRPGPRSLGPATRFVVDHAPCPVLLVWPQPPPGVGSLPPQPHP